KEQALVSRPHKRSYHGIEVRGSDNAPEMAEERAEIVGRTIAGLELRFSAEPDGSRAAFRDPTLPHGFHQLADERRWEHSTPETRRELAVHILPFTGVSAEELVGQRAQALDLRARYSALAHRRFWETALDEMPDKLFRVMSTVHNIRGTSVEAERVFAGMTFETRGRKAPSASKKAGAILFIRHHASAHPDLGKLAEDALVLLKRKMLLSTSRGKSQWRPRVMWWTTRRGSGRRDALDEVEANMSDTYRSDDDDDDDDDDDAEGDDEDADSEGDDDAAEVVLAGARRALLSVDAVLGTEQTRQAPPVHDEDTMSEADLSAALEELIKAAEGGRRRGSDTSGSTAGTSTSGETGATTSSLIQRVKDRRRAPDPGQEPACDPPPPPPRRPSAGPPEEEYDFDEWELRSSPAQLSPLAVPDGLLGSNDVPSWLWGEAPAVPSTRLPDQASVCLVDGHRFYGVHLNSLLPGEIPTQTAVDLLLSDVARLCADL
ncbi:MAG: hypothetical protein GY856_22215, partial [bacterium]|nr:hypothetical protein [bacterium]